MSAAAVAAAVAGWYVSSRKKEEEKECSFHKPKPKQPRLRIYEEQKNLAEFLTLEDMKQIERELENE